MKSILITIFFLLSINIYSQDNMENINSIIKEVKQTFAPDKRVALFNIDVVQNNNILKLSGETNLPEAKKELLKHLAQHKYKIEDEIISLPSKQLGDKIYGVINLSVANMRSTPEHSAELTTQAILGTPIKVLKKGSNGFYLVQTPDGYISWTEDDGFEPMNKIEITDWLKFDKIIFLDEFGFSYSLPDLASSRVSDLVVGNILKLFSSYDNFYKVEYPDGRTAYVEKSKTQNYDQWKSNLSPTAESILNDAHKFFGIPYLWGGTSAKGMDCSGFTKTVYFMNGYVLPRDASQQVHIGELVDTENGWENLKAGDLLFFGTKAKNDRKERITHVAIYIGDGDFIHAAGRVKINSFNPSKKLYSEFRTSGFIRARRILGINSELGVQLIDENSFYK